MDQQTVLVVEDEKNIQELLKYNLKQEGFQVVLSSTGDQGLRYAQKNLVHLIILDLMLPGIGGLEVCKTLRQNEETKLTPIIMLTAKGTETDKIVGLELGADDYVTKPFSVKELIARVKAILRRTQTKAVARTKITKVGSLKLDPNTHKVVIKDKEVELTSKEFHLLKTFLESGGRVLSREHLLSKVWGYDKAMNIETRTVDIHIGQLRKKLKSESKRIITITNEGYRFNLDS